MYHVYVLKSKKDQKLYIGHTKDLVRRLQLHNSGQVKSTAPRRPLKLLYYESCNKLVDAVARERSLKTGFGRAYLKRRLSNLK